MNVSGLGLCYLDALTGCLLGSLTNCSFIASLRCQMVPRNCLTPMYSIPDLDIEGIIDVRLHNFQPPILSC